MSKSKSYQIPGNPFPIPFVIFIGCMIGLITFGPRSTMGFFQIPIIEANGWSREIFGLAIAIQNLTWGVAQPVAGMFADRFGSIPVLIGGTFLYILGLVLMAYSSDPIMLHFSAGVLMGMGIAASAFFLVLSAFAKILPEEWRSLAFGLGTAAGSFGQFVFAPIGMAFIELYGYQTALLLLGGCIAFVPFLTFALRGKTARAETSHEEIAVNNEDDKQTLRQALAQGFSHPSYLWLTAGFFVCGFHVAFITVHMPAYIEIDLGLSPSVGAWSIGIIGFFNTIGAVVAGYLSGRQPKRYVLSWIYLLRAVAIGLFLVAPASELAVYLFSAAMGLLWLSTIPPTKGLVALMFGNRYLATLFGFVFLSHQIGSFLGIWIGGVFYERLGSYDMVWYIGIALGLFAAIVHLPIREMHVKGAAAPASA